MKRKCLLRKQWEVALRQMGFDEKIFPKDVHTFLTGEEWGRHKFWSEQEVPCFLVEGYFTVISKFAKILHRTKGSLADSYVNTI